MTDDCMHMACQCILERQQKLEQENIFLKRLLHDGTCLVATGPGHGQEEEWAQSAFKAIFGELNEQ